MLAQWTKEYLDKLPERAAYDIQTALEYGNGERTLKDVAADVTLGSKQIWMHSTEDGKFNATVVTQVVDFPRKRTCEIVYLGGDHAVEFISDIQVIEDWARENGCEDIQVIGRESWARLLKKQGYDKRYTVTGKKL